VVVAVVAAVVVVISQFSYINWPLVYYESVNYAYYESYGKYLFYL
jgi:hypothetical protein